MPRAAHKDWIIERGTTARLGMQVWSPSNTASPAGALLPGDHVVIEDRVEIVATVTLLNDSVELRFGQGLWSDLKLVMKTADVVQMAAQTVPATVLAAAEYDYPVIYTDDGIATGGPLLIAIDSAVGEDGTVILTLDADTTRGLPDGVGQWDVIITDALSGDSLRVLEGQFSAVPTVSSATLTTARSTR